MKELITDLKDIVGKMVTDVKMSGDDIMAIHFGEEVLLIEAGQPYEDCWELKVIKTLPLRWWSFYSLTYLEVCTKEEEAAARKIADEEDAAVRERREKDLYYQLKAKFESTK
jgi:hypothetical protein